MTRQSQNFGSRLQYFGYISSCWQSFQAITTTDLSKALKSLKRLKKIEE